MPDPEPVEPSDGSAEDLYCAWCLAGERGEGTPFDVLCDQHPHLAESLRRILEQDLFLRWLASVAGGDASPTEVREREACIEYARELRQWLERFGAPAPKYLRQREIGRGAMGAVFEATDQLLGRKIAVKVSLDDTEEQRRLPFFRREMELAGALSHPGVAAVHDAGVDHEGRVYFTMPLVEGRNLSDVFEQVAAGAEDWNLVRAVGVLAQVAETMAYVHSCGVIHRDLKPANIRVGRFGEVFVMDWGVATRRTVQEVTPSQSPGDAGAYATDAVSCGTIPYSSPEQMRSVASAGPGTDVYAIGVMLYELLASRKPLHRVGESFLTGPELAHRARSEEIEPIHAIARHRPAELVSICARAMEQDPARRYSDCGALARDLRAFLEQRVVSAHESGTWAETRKWILRNRSLAAAIAATLVVSIAGAIGFRWKAAEATAAVNDFRSISFAVDLNDMKVEAETLWPLTADMVPRIEDWIRRCRKLIGDAGNGPFRNAATDRFSRQLQQIGPVAPEGDIARSGTPTANAIASRIQWYRRMLGDEPWPDEAAIRTEVEAEPMQLDFAYMFSTIAPSLRTDPSSRTYGEEVRARLLLERLLGVQGNPPFNLSELQRIEGSHSLRWACVNGGRMDLALQGYGDPEWDSAKPVALLRRKALEREIARWSGDAAREARRTELRGLEQLQKDRSRLDRWTTFVASPESGASGRWWTAQLAPVLAALCVLESRELGGLLNDGTSTETGWGMLRRLEAAKSIRERTVDGDSARHRWAEALADIEVNPRYSRVVWPGGRLEPQEGLLPIGRDGHSGLWEFLVVLSGEEPSRDDQGALRMDGSSGIVLILVPGGEFEMGAQAVDRASPNYDPYADSREGPVRRVALSPYFISKYELTQGQWERCEGRNPSNLKPPSVYIHSLAHPVDQVSWLDGERYLRRLGLVFPTEAQWEFACRAGTATPWWLGGERESLRGLVNIADQSTRRAGVTLSAIADWPDLDDGIAYTAPVGLLPANQFGLHEVHGNLWEWCADAWGWPHPGASAGSEGVLTDPVRDGPPNSARVSRGGCMGNTALQCRVTPRAQDHPDTRMWTCGIRPARAITPARSTQ
jgi:formylglycine-generating enzyme required for sulfatase activity/serine/threonine protein kinase